MFRIGCGGEEWLRKIRWEKSVYGRGVGVCINNTTFEKREGNCLNRTQVLMRAEINEMKQFEALDPFKKIMRRSVCKFVFMDAILGFERITGDEKLRFLSWRDREQRTEEGWE